MTFGLHEDEWKLVETLVVLPLKKLGATVYVFGSRARGSHQKFSDLDIMFEMSGSEIQLHELAHIKDELENSSLPIKVDLVNRAELANSYLESSLKDRVVV